MQSGTTSSDMPRVLLVDDNEAMLARAAAVLTPHCVVVGAVRDALAALGAAGRLQPDVIVLDISMPGMSGLELAHRLRQAGSTAALVFLTVHDAEEFVSAAKAAGAVGYARNPRLVPARPPPAREAGPGLPFGSQTPGPRH